MKRILQILLVLLLISCGVTDRYNPPYFLDMAKPQPPPKEFCKSKPDTGYIEGRLDPSKTFKDCEGKIIACYDQKLKSYCYPRLSSDGIKRCLPLAVERRDVASAGCNEFMKNDVKTIDAKTIMIYSNTDPSVNYGYNFWIEIDNKKGYWKGTKPSLRHPYVYALDSMQRCVSQNLIGYPSFGPIDDEPLVRDNHFPEMVD